MIQRYWVLFLFFLLYIVHLGLKFWHVPVPIWASSYWADALCMPLFLSFLLFSIRKIKQTPSFYLSLNMIVFVWAYLSFTFEFLLPFFSKKYTADKVDVLIYALGGLFFYFFQKKIT